MNWFAVIGQWLTDSAHWHGSDGVPVRVLEHLEYTGLALGLALVIGLPIGAIVGHTGRGGFLLVGLANYLRALPSVGLLVIAFVVIGLGLVPPIAALTVLALPPVLAGSYAGIQAVDPAVVDAAKGMGMRWYHVLFRVEIPNAMPLIFGGIRSAALQVVATATIAAEVALGGLGRFIIDGNAEHNETGFAQMAAGAVLVAVLALVVEGVFVLVQRLVVSPGLRAGRAGGRGGQKLESETGGS
ncbi:MAG TPA: ABC transporter permease [Pseudonocardiaceae bacterium]|jgi:osmoprotectant transport system permease protein|nr:ABC transporter permease [Pseudonocardiaceae bacterium]